jgi:tetratricopeptide (TPR) repeat protein
VDPTSSEAKGQVTSVKSQVAKLVAAMTASIQKLVASSKFTDARTQLNGMNDLNRRTSNSFDADVSAAAYSLSFSWAKYLYAQKDYATAESRIDAALAIKRSDEAASLKRQISAARTQSDAGASFDTALQDVDRLIAAGELASANSRLVAVTKVTTDQTKLATLSDRHQSIIDKLKAVYDRGVQAYQDEDFKTAIELLQTVVSVQVDYQQAGDYLDRARSKQKVLDQLQ